jgi:hypothetical protein
MKAGVIDTSTLSNEIYWKYFQKLIFTADGGTTLTTMGWILFWLDHIPEHVIHSHFITGFLFLGALSLGLAGARVMVQTRNRLGTRADRFFHFVKISYTLLSSISGIYAYLRFPSL